MKFLSPALSCTNRHANVPRHYPPLLLHKRVQIAQTRRAMEECK